MSSQPLVSVCIPCYNGEAFIASTLESVLHQTLADFEIVVSDNKSTDNTFAILSTFKDTRIKLCQNDSNLGLGENWNKVLSRAAGKYVKLLCADDLLYPECLARQAAVLENPSNAPAVLAICNRDTINAQDEIILRRKIPWRAGLMNGGKLIQTSVRWGTNLIGEPAVGLFRREALNRTQMCDPSNPFVIDLALWADLLKLGDVFVDTASLAAFRVSAASASASIGFRQAAYFRSYVRSVRREIRFRISPWDALSGYALSLPWCLLRNLFIRHHSRRRPEQVGAPPRFRLGSGFPATAEQGRLAHSVLGEATVERCPTVRSLNL